MDGMYKIGEIGIPKIKNGSKIEIGKDIGKITIMSDHRFNWFQKKMIKWCFGFEVSAHIITNVHNTTKEIKTSEEIYIQLCKISRSLDKIRYSFEPHSIAGLRGECGPLCGGEVDYEELCLNELATIERDIFKIKTYIKNPELGLKIREIVK